MYADLNDDGNITAEDRDIIGNPFPKYSYSFNLGASWKNLICLLSGRELQEFIVIVGRQPQIFAVTSLTVGWIVTQPKI